MALIFLAVWACCGTLEIFGANFLCIVKRSDSDLITAAIHAVAAGDLGGM